MRIIPARLFKNRFIDTFIDDEDYDYIQSLKLSSIFLGTDGGVICEFPGQIRKYLSRVVMRYDGPLFVDHRDLNKLNNQKENLRLATPQQNSANTSRRSHNKSVYKGVRKRYGRINCNGYFCKVNTFEACITIKGKYKYLGSFKTEIEAAITYNKAALELHGEFARLNNIPKEIKL